MTPIFTNGILNNNIQQPIIRRGECQNKKVMFIQNKRLGVILITVASLLFIPLLAMQFTEEVSWTLSDFVVAGALLMGTGLMVDMVLRKVTQTKYRIALCAALVIGLLLVWAELAVGVFGSPFAGQ